MCVCVCVCGDLFFAAATNLMFMTKIDVGQDLAVAIELTRGFSNLLLSLQVLPSGKEDRKRFFRHFPFMGRVWG